MDQLHKFLFEGLPVRGMLVRLTDTWQEVLRRRSAAGGYPPAVTSILGEMSAAATLMTANIKFNGALVLQILGDGPVKVAVTEVQPDLALRSTATLVGTPADDLLGDASLRELVNVQGHGRCAITLDPKDKLPGQRAYQGIVPLNDERGRSLPNLAAVLEQYMRQSEQLETRLVLAANDRVAAGLLIQRLPQEGGQAGEGVDADGFNRIAHLTATLTSEELLALDVEAILRRLYWEETVRRFEPLRPRFACTCSRERVSGMLRTLGGDEVNSILAERGDVEIGCDFCGAQYRFDAVDVGGLVTPGRDSPPVTKLRQ